VHRLLAEAVTVVVVHRGHRSVDGDLAEVGPTESGELSVEIGEQPGVQQRIVDHVDAGHQMAGVEGDLLGLGEVVGRVPIQCHAADDADRTQLFGNQLGRVEQVDALEGLVLGVGHDLNGQVPFGEVAGGDAFVQIATMEIGVDAAQLLALFPHQAVHAGGRLPVPFDQRGGAVGSHQTEGVDPEPLHGGVGARDGPIRHDPHQHVGRLGLQRHEIPERVVGGSGLGDLPVGLGLHRMDQVGELEPVLDEEDRDVVADQIEIAFVRVELGGETADVPSSVGRATGPGHRRESHEDWRLGALAQEAGRTQVVEPRRCGEDAVGAGPTGVDHPLGDALVVEVGDLLAEVEVLHQRRAPLALLQRVVGVIDPQALGRGQPIAGLGPRQFGGVAHRIALGAGFAHPGSPGLLGGGDCAGSRCLGGRLHRPGLSLCAGSGVAVGRSGAVLGDSFAWWSSGLGRLLRGHCRTPRGLRWEPSSRSPLNPTGNLGRR